MKLNITKIDPNLQPFEQDLQLRMENYQKTKKRILPAGVTLGEFANGHHYFGFHRTDKGWYYREWAPAAEKVYLTGDFCGWDRHAYPMEPLGNGIFELFLSGVDALKNGERVCTVVVHGGKELDRIPLYANYVVQDPVTTGWSAMMHIPEKPFRWNDGGFVPQKNLLIYLPFYCSQCNTFYIRLLR